MRLPDGEPTGPRYHGVFGSSDTTLVERFTRVDANTIDYQFTVTAPRTFVKPWTAAAPLTRLDAPLFEYACHEGNYAIPQHAERRPRPGAGQGAGHERTAVSWS